MGAFGERGLVIEGGVVENMNTETGRAVIRLQRMAKPGGKLVFAAGCGRSAGLPLLDRSVSLNEQYERQTFKRGFDALTELASNHDATEGAGASQSLH